MEQITNLTKLQKKLVNELISEFTKINPTNSNNTSRFTINTIHECMREEEKFKETIKQHNFKMIDIYVSQLKKDVEKFEEEYGTIIKIEMGYSSNNDTCTHYTLEKMIAENKRKPFENNNSSNTELFFVSKVKLYNGDSRYDYFGAMYKGVFVDFKREKIEFTLESGKIVYAYKIIGLQYNTESWLHRDRGYTYNTLDEMIQSNKQIQQSIVKLVQ
jgi:hypothetical protein